MDIFNHKTEIISSSCGETFQLFFNKKNNVFLAISFKGDTSQFMYLIINLIIPFFLNKTSEEINLINFEYFYSFSNLNFFGNRKIKTEEIFNLIKKKSLLVLNKH